MVDQGNEKNLVYCFDIDETICKTTDMNYENASPIVDRISKLNRLFDDGNVIKLFTARGSETGINWRETTESQLKRWGLNYHELHFGKPAADVYVDDKAVNEKDFNWEFQNASNLPQIK